mmetsp:Transcript_13843/g.34883  ORF Transcript_13843/g.34883 Transcript_13843/m.34883 type:complete len:126 (-) Transcript_13843:338-715(-)
MENGVWDAIHVIEVLPKDQSQAEYKLTSTVMLSAAKKDVFRLEGSLTRQAERQSNSKHGHLPNVGAMVEEMEGDMRDSLQQVSWTNETKQRRNSGNSLCTIFAIYLTLFLCPGIFWVVLSGDFSH